MKFLLMLCLTFSCLFAKAQSFPKDFVFGVANAPGQVEDQLDDIWLDWGKQGNIRGWKQNASPEKRLEFWSKPQIEINQAKDLGVGAFRMGLDWGRIMPSRASFDEKAIQHYHHILSLLKAKKIKIMLTLWHHSVPKWVQETDGWNNDENKKAFLEFSRRMISEFQSDVDWWVTFNEANVFENNSNFLGIWPPGKPSSALSFLDLGFFKGRSLEALDRIAETHNEIYTWAHQKFPKIQMGIAHNMAQYRGKGFLNQALASFVDGLMNWRFLEKIKSHMDFFGFNYYGAEWLNGMNLDIDPTQEYSDSGRAIDVDGLYELLQKINVQFKNIPIIITENGIADSEDYIRSSYFIEHLLAVSKAVSEGIPVKAFFAWTLTDNLEWSDGFCPQFGFLSVDRTTFRRKTRPSYFVFKDIIENKNISLKMRNAAWEKVLAMQGKNRPFCRAEDGKTAYDVAQPRKFSMKNWKFSYPIF